MCFGGENFDSGARHWGSQWGQRKVREIWELKAADSNLIFSCCVFVLLSSLFKYFFFMEWTGPTRGEIYFLVLKYLNKILLLSLWWKHKCWFFKVRPNKRKKFPVKTICWNLIFFSLHWQKCHKVSTCHQTNLPKKLGHLPLKKFRSSSIWKNIIVFDFNCLG